MIKLVATIIITLVTIQSISAQKNKIISFTIYPSVGVSKLDGPKINSITIYEWYTIVSINTAKKTRIKLSSQSIICSADDLDDKYQILEAQNYELDEWNDIYEPCDIFLKFPRIPPGIEKINIELPQSKKTMIYWWNVKINNPKTNPVGNSKGLLSGTGFALTSDGLIVTNNHVVEGASKILLKGINGQFDRTYNAKIVMQDKNNDLALIKIEDESFKTLGNIPYVIKNNVANAGEEVFVLGYPLRATMGDEIKLTNGIISSRTGFQGDVTSYQISVPVQPGNSGGPLFDSNGNLIGIINAKHSDAENVSYAVKTSYLKNLIDLLDNRPKLQNVNSLKGKTLSQQVQLVNKYVYIIESE